MQAVYNKDFTIGADPEMFLKKNGKYVAVQGYVEGTKDKPQTLPQGGNAQRDNVAIEFGILPAISKTDFINHIGDTLVDLKDLLPADVSLDVVPSAYFPKRQLAHKECQQFGCDPDLNAWTMKVNEPPKDAAKGTFRSCGGHIHVGYVAKGGSDYKFLEDIDGKSMMIRTMDCIHGIISTVLDNSEEAIARRKLYGKAGCFRPTEYGVEYRTLSNYWIKSPKLVELMYSLTEDALEVMYNMKSIELINMLGGQDEIQRVITEGDATAAESLMFSVVGQYLSENSIKLIDAVIGGTIDTFDFENEWKGVA